MNPDMRVQGNMRLPPSASKLLSSGKEGVDGVGPVGGGSSSSRNKLDGIDPAIIAFYRIEGKSDEEIYNEACSQIKYTPTDPVDRRNSNPGASSSTTTSTSTARPLPPPPPPISNVLNPEEQKSSKDEVKYTPELHKAFFDYVYNSEDHRISGQNVDRFKKEQNIFGKMRYNGVCQIESYDGQRGSITWVSAEICKANGLFAKYGLGYYEAKLFSKKLPPPPPGSTTKPKPLPPPPVEVHPLDGHPDNDNVHVRRPFGPGTNANANTGSNNNTGPNASAAPRLYSGQATTSVPAKVFGRKRSNLSAFEVHFGVRVTRQENLGELNDQGLSREILFEFESKSEASITHFKEFIEKIGERMVNERVEDLYTSLTNDTIGTRLFIDYFAVLNGIAWKDQDGSSFNDQRQTDIKKVLGIFTRGNRKVRSCFSAISGTAVKRKNFQPKQVNGLVYKFEEELKELTASRSETPYCSSSKEYVTDDKICDEYRSAFRAVPQYDRELCIIVLGKDDHSNDSRTDSYENLIRLILGSNGSVEVWCWKFQSFNRLKRLSRIFGSEYKKNVSFHTFDDFQASLIAYPVAARSRPENKVGFAPKSGPGHRDRVSEQPDDSDSSNSNEKDDQHTILESSDDSDVKRDQKKPEAMTSDSKPYPESKPDIAQPNSGGLIGGGDRGGGSPASVPAFDKEYIDQCLTCPITSELFVNPVITPAGISYEQDALLQWLQHSEEDPLSHTQLRAEDLKPNLSVKNLCDLIRSQTQKK